MTALSILLANKSPSVPLSERGKTTSPCRGGDERRFTCPASGAAITDSTCRLSRKANPAVCANCLVPLADDASETPLHIKCDHAPSLRGMAGFPTPPSLPLDKGRSNDSGACASCRAACEHCWGGDAA